jgi:hypothetical protein
VTIPHEFSTFTRILRSCQAEVHVCAHERKAALLAAYTVIVGKPLPPLPSAPFKSTRDRAKTPMLFAP